jgi:KaiC domain protein
VSEDDATDEGDWFEEALGDDDQHDETDGAESDEDSAFGEPESSEEDPFSSTDSGDSDGVFDDDFASAFESASGDEFEDEEFESAIPRIDIGIEGLDEMIQGGIPRRHLIVAIGAPGAGKTTFGLQFLHHGLEAGEPGVFLTLEQSRETIIDTANERGWEFDRYENEEEMLAVVDLDPVEMANSLDNIRGELPELIREFGADRLVLDSVSLLEMMYDDQSRRRTEVFDFTRSLKEAGVTTFLTSEASESNPYASRHGIIEYLTDAVFVLQYVRSESREARLAVEIQKIRNANHSREMKPYEITMDGISVYQQANIF